MLAAQLTNSGQLGAVMSDVIRSKAADLLARRVKVTDESGRKVELGREDEAPKVTDDGRGTARRPEARPGGQRRGRRDPSRRAAAGAVAVAAASKESKEIGGRGGRCRRTPAGCAYSEQAAAVDVSASAAG